MPLVVPKVAALRLLFLQMNGFNSTMHLYKNDFTPDLDTVVGDLVEADFDGYTPMAVSGWSAPVTVSDHAKTIANLVEWIHGGGATANNIFGYYLLEDGTNDLMWVERDPNAPVLMQAGSPPYQIIPAFTRISEFS